MKKYTLQDFIEKAEFRHGTNYDYSATVFKNSQSKVDIICRKHGVFTQDPYSHISGAGCPLCSRITRKKTHEKFLAEMISVYGENPDFKVLNVYKTSKTPILLEDKFGKYEISSAVLLRGCKLTMTSAVNKTENAVNRLNEVHENKYDYTKFIYALKAKSCVVCPQHGDFYVSYSQHMKGSGCPKCGLLARSKKRVTPIEEFIRKAKLVHGEKYNYEKVSYINAQKSVELVCDVHGSFWKIANNHLRGQGCKECRRRITTGWSKTGWLACASDSKLFVNFSLYIVKLYSEGESFIKIGITFRGVPSRMLEIPYAYEEIFTFTHLSHAKIMELENEIHKKYRDYKYIPTNIFGGMHECFNLSLPTDEIISYLSLQVHDTNPTTN